MNPMDAYLKVLSNFAVFSGRARRSEYWYFVLINAIISIVLGYVIPILSTVYFIAMLLPSLAAAVRRMHDVGKSGWFILIPIYNLVLAVSDSQPGANEYGENQKGETGSFVVEPEKKSAKDPYANIEVSEWINNYLLAAIPLVGIVLLINWAGDRSSMVRRNWAVATLIFAGILTVAVGVIAVILYNRFKP